MSIDEGILQEGPKLEGFAPPVEAPVAAPGVGERIMSLLMDKLFVQTGPGPLCEYDTHPLNFNGKRWLSRIIRGCTGIFAALDLAIIDIAVGLIEMREDKASVAPVDY
jgi:hypothetical protein